MEIAGRRVPPPAAGLPEAERKALALQLRGDAPDAQQRAARPPSATQVVDHLFRVILTLVEQPMRRSSAHAPGG